MKSPFRHLAENPVVIARWRQFYNRRRPHSALDYRTPVQARTAKARHHQNRPQPRRLMATKSAAGHNTEKYRVLPPNVRVERAARGRTSAPQALQSSARLRRAR
ncbi:MAG: integrase core domain-containing protein [Woeseiaceae bacterium]